MPFQIIGSGTRMDNVTIVKVTSDGRLLTSAEISGTVTTTASTGSVVIKQVDPNDTSQNNSLNKFEYIISGTSSGVTGSEIGSIVQFIGVGSFVQVFSWSNDLVTQIGSWS